MLGVRGQRRVSILSLCISCCSHTDALLSGVGGGADLVGGEVRRTVCGGAAPPGAITVAMETGKGLPGCTAAAAAAAALG